MPKDKYNDYARDPAYYFERYSAANNLTESQREAILEYAFDGNYWHVWYFIIVLGIELFALIYFTSSVPHLMVRARGHCIYFTLSMLMYLMFFHFALLSVDGKDGAMCLPQGEISGTLIFFIGFHGLIAWVMGIAWIHSWNRWRDHQSSKTAWSLCAPREDFEVHDDDEEQCPCMSKHTQSRNGLLFTANLSRWPDESGHQRHKMASAAATRGQPGVRTMHALVESSDAQEYEDESCFGFSGGLTPSGNDVRNLDHLPGSASTDVDALHFNNTDNKLKELVTELAAQVQEANAANLRVNATLKKLQAAAVFAHAGV